MWGPYADGECDDGGRAVRNQGSGAKGVVPDFAGGVHLAARVYPKRRHEAADGCVQGASGVFWYPIDGWAFYGTGWRYQDTGDTVCAGEDPGEAGDLVHSYGGGCERAGGRGGEAGGKVISPKGRWKRRTSDG